MMGRLKGKVALVTGGSRGIGAGIVKKLALEGAFIAFTYVNSNEKAMALEAFVIENNGQAFAIKADSSNAEEMNATIDKVFGKYGKIDILVNNAGLFIGGEINNPNADVEALNRMWQVNVVGVVQTVRSIVPHLKAGSRIISIGSGAASHVPFAGVSDYAATKAALVAYTKGWARDLADKNITVNIIQPGLIDTDLKPDDENAISAMLQPVALKRFGTPEEIGNVVTFLASDEASYITGAAIDVDGGLSA